VGKAADAWILARKAEGCWVTHCPSCGCLFAQNRHLRGRRASSCNWKRCILWHRWRWRHGRAPPAWLCLRWREVYGDAADPQHIYAYQRVAA
jgi:hypothetical protein